MSRKQWMPEGFIRVWKVRGGYSLELGQPTDLIYNIEQGIIYYYFANKKSQSLCPYYGKHGKPCTIKNMQIVEVE